MVPPTRTNPTTLVDDKSEDELNRIGSSFISESGFIPFEGNEKILIFKDDKLEENLKPAAQMLGILKRGAHYAVFKSGDAHPRTIDMGSQVFWIHINMPVKQRRELVYNEKGVVVLKPNFTYFIIIPPKDNAGDSGSAKVS